MTPRQHLRAEQNADTEVLVCQLCDVAHAISHTRYGSQTASTSAIWLRRAEVILKGADKIKRLQRALDAAGISK